MGSHPEFLYATLAPCVKAPAGAVLLRLTLIQLFTSGTRDGGVCERLILLTYDIIDRRGRVLK